MNTSILERLILPWQAYYDETYKRNFYYNTQTQESVWELPQEIQARIKMFEEEYEKVVKEKANNESNNNNEQEEGDSSNNNEEEENDQDEENNENENNQNSQVEKNSKKNINNNNSNKNQPNNNPHPQKEKQYLQKIRENSSQQQQQQQKEELINMSNCPPEDEDQKEEEQILPKGGLSEVPQFSPNSKNSQQQKSSSFSQQQQQQQQPEKVPLQQQSQVQVEQRESQGNEEALQQSSSSPPPPYEEANMLKFLPQEVRQSMYKREILDFMRRPARKQVDQPLSSLYSYRQGDEEYNIWYNKYLSDMKSSQFKDREAAKTRCNPEIDVGYTRADLYEKYASYFCIHFVHGCCSEGAGCKYFHRVPSLQECQTVDHTRDIFGRARHASHREDMAGVGSFMNETRTLMVTEFKIVNSSGSSSLNSNQLQGGTEDGLTQMYETLYRHFQEWGELEDIKLLPNKGLAFVRFKHRCMAEFAKEAMQSQALDRKEVLQIKWAQDETEAVAGGAEQREREDAVALKKAVEKQHSQMQHSEKLKLLQERRAQLVQMNSGNSNYAGEQLKDIDDLEQYEFSDVARGSEFDEERRKKQEQIINNVEKMNAILEQIDQQGGEDGEKPIKNFNVYQDINSSNNNFSSLQQLKNKVYLPPEFNDQPLFFK